MTQVQSWGWEDPLEKEMAAHSSTLAWKIPWSEERGRLESMGSQKSWTRLSHFIMSCTRVSFVFSVLVVLVRASLTKYRRLVFISHGFGGWAAGQFTSWWELSSRLADSCLLSQYILRLPSVCACRQRSLSSSFYKATNPVGLGPHSYDLS